MKTNYLLLFLFLLIPWRTMAQEETYYSLTVTDIPEGVDKYSLQAFLIYQEKDYQECIPMNYNEEKNVYELSTSYPFVEKGTAQIALHAPSLLPASDMYWDFTPGAEVQSKTVSMNKYKRVSVETEQGWGLCVQAGKQYMLTGFNLFAKDMNDALSTFAGGAGTLVESPEDNTPYYFYAQPGEYLWNGPITRLSDMTKIQVNKTPFTVTQDGTALIKPDREEQTLINIKVIGLDANPQLSFELTHHLDENTGLATQIFIKEAQTNLFVKKGKYTWRGTPRREESYLPQEGSFTAGEEPVNITLDFSNYIPQKISLKLPDGHEYINSIEYTVSQGDIWFSKYGYEKDMLIYLPEDVSVTAEIQTLELPNTSVWKPAPQTFTPNAEKEVLFDCSSYHLVSFFCENMIQNSVVARSDNPDNTLFGSAVYLPDGQYHAWCEYATPTGSEVRLEKDFTVSGQGMNVHYDYNPADYASVMISLTHPDAIPEFVTSEHISVDIYQGDKRVHQMNFFPKQEGAESNRLIGLKKGTYQYQARFVPYGPDCISIPATGTFEVKDGDNTLDFDLSEFCYIPVKITGAGNQLINSLYFLPEGQNAIYMHYLMQPDAYFIGKPGNYNFTFFAARHATLKQNITATKDTPEIAFSMTPAEVYPLMIGVLPDDENMIYTVTVDGVGSYTMNNKTEEISEGDILPFMAVQPGTYKLTVTAPDYETYTDMIEVSANTFIEEEGFVSCRVILKKSGTAIKDVTQTEKPVIGIQGNRVSVTANTNCQVMIYQINGTCVASGYGQQIQSQPLQPGLYVVKAVTANATATQKVVISR